MFCSYVILTATVYSNDHCYISGGRILRFGALKENIVHLVKILLTFPLKLFALFGFLLHGYWQRQNCVDVPGSSINNQILQCLDHLKKLENEFTEISSKPVKIPEASEKLLTDSLERIKSLELDLEKTKSVRTLSILALHYYL